jgi:hypothetical protein
VHWITPAGQEKGDTVLLFLHGGGYIGGYQRSSSLSSLPSVLGWWDTKHDSPSHAYLFRSLVSHGAAAAQLGHKAETRVLFVEYR